MKASTKYLCLYAVTLVTLVLMVTRLAQAQTDVPPPPQTYEIEPVEEQSSQSTESEPLDQAELDQMLAPIALYPDTLLSHILVASTYPLEVVQAARWREQNADLSAESAREAVQEKEWDPSVKALAPFADLLETMSEDLDWLKRLGDAFLLNEDQLLSSVQALRRRAYERGNLEDNEYIEVVEEDADIIIQPVEREVVHVPYYDTRVVYGPWWWHDHAPIFWHHPRHYYSYAGFYWGPRIFVRPHFYFGGFHWRRRHTVVSHHVFHHGIRYDDGIRRVRVREYPRWQHNPGHRRGVRYHHAVSKSVYRHNKARPIDSFTGNKKAHRAQVRTKEIRNDRRRAEVAQNTRTKLQRHRDQPVRTTNAVRNNQRQQVKERIRRQESNQSVRSPDRHRANATQTSRQRDLKPRTRSYTERHRSSPKRETRRASSPRHTSRSSTKAPSRAKSSSRSRSVERSSSPKRSSQRAVKRN